MLNLKQAVYLLLSQNVGVTAIVDAGTGMMTGFLSQSATYPAISIQWPDEDSITSLSGSCGLAQSTIRVFCASKVSDAQAEQVAELVRLALADVKNREVSDGLSPESTLKIQGIFSAGRFEGKEDRTGTWQVGRDFDVSAHEAIPVHA